MHARRKMHLLPKQHHSRTYPYFKFWIMNCCNKSAICILNVTVTSLERPFCKFPTTTITIWCMPMTNIFLFQFVHNDVIKWKYFRITGPLCGEFTGQFSSQRSETRSFDVFFDLRLNKRLSKQSWGWWFETPSRSLWRHRNEIASLVEHFALPVTIYKDTVLNLDVFDSCLYKS